LLYLLELNISINQKEGTGYQDYDKNGPPSVHAVWRVATVPGSDAVNIIAVSHSSHSMWKKYILPHLHQ